MKRYKSLQEAKIKLPANAEWTGRVRLGFKGSSTTVFSIGSKKEIVNEFIRRFGPNESDYSFMFMQTSPSNTYALIKDPNGNKAWDDLTVSIIEDLRFDDNIKVDSDLDKIEKLKGKIKKVNYNKYKYFTHRSKNWRDILKQGIKPIVNIGFKELDNLKYSMFIGNTGTNFKSLEYVNGNVGDGIIVFEKTKEFVPMLEYIQKQGLLNLRLYPIFDRIYDWFISLKTIKPNNIVVIYDPMGKVLYEKI